MKPDVKVSETTISYLQSVCSKLEANNAGECGAREGYFDFIEYLYDIKSEVSNEYCDIIDEVIKDIQEIISDEQNHTNKINGWVSKLSGLVAAKD